MLNAGDGRHEHPTQALLDALTIRRAKGRLHRLNDGDLRRYRPQPGGAIQHHFVGQDGKPRAPCRPADPDALGKSATSASRSMTTCAKGLEGCDVVMMLRLQKERMDGGFIPSEREYYHRYGLDAEKLASCQRRRHCHAPRPMNRGVEIDGTMADDINRSVIQEQVEMGVAVRMAAMDLLARNLRTDREAASLGVMV